MAVIESDAKIPWHFEMGNEKLCKCPAWKMRVHKWHGTE
jgi:hypothetical protein